MAGYMNRERASRLILREYAASKKSNADDQRLGTKLRFYILTRCPIVMQRSKIITLGEKCLGEKRKRKNGVKN